MYSVFSPNFLPQCAIPVFEGLLEDDALDKQLMELLYLLAYWQALAKLRLHTERTLDVFRSVTRSGGITLRAFQKRVNTTIPTKELAREAASRVRRMAKVSQKRTKYPETCSAGNAKSYPEGTANKGKDVARKPATRENPGK